MEEMESQVREWGRSLGIVIPKKVVSKERLKAGDTIKILLVKRSNAIRKTFGTFKFKKSTEEMLHEADRECWDE